MSSFAAGDSDSIKAKGNDAFNNGQFQEAEELYTQAIQAAGGEGSATAALLGNRSAARLSLNKHQEALADAELAIRKDPKWIKGYHRKACAHRTAGDIPAALAAYREAGKVEPKNRWLREQEQQTIDALYKDSIQRDIPSQQYWLAVYGSIKEPRERLCTLARCWNGCQPEERLKVFSRFLEVMAGGGEARAGQVPTEQDAFNTEEMRELPMDNYEDVPLHDTWMNFFHKHNAEEKVALFEAMWSHTSEKDRDVVIQDLKFFFLKPKLEARYGVEGEDQPDVPEPAAASARSPTVSHKRAHR